jgi:ABC-type multidrug transport system ATPase subunit
VSAGYDGKDVLHDVEWRIAPGERTGLLGVNGAGKSTLLGLITGDNQPSAGTVRRGQTVRIAALSQQLGQLEDHLGEPVRDILARLRTSYTIGSGSKAQDLTPGQLLERLGFSTAQLSTPVKDLSGGQQRRLQLLLILLDQPNVLILDEPTNDMDTDMLAVIEDLLDSWPGTLIVVSHDRYFIERVTDQQYAILRGHLRHLPGGVDEYLRLRAAESAAGISRTPATVATIEPTARADSANSGTSTALTGAALRDTQKEIASVERRLAKLTDQITGAKNALATHDHADYQGLTKRMKEISALEADVQALEERWFELTELLG